MAVKPCPDCRKDVSDKAPSCPHCGRPMNNYGNWKRTTEGGKFLDPGENARGCLRVVLVVFILMVIGFVISSMQ